MIYYYSPEQRHIRFRGDIVEGELLTEKEVFRLFGQDAFKYLEKMDIPASHTFRSFGVRFIYAPAFFTEKGAPKYARFYLYKKSDEVLPYTAVFLKTEADLRGDLEAICLNSLGYYEHVSVQKGASCGSRITWEDIPDACKAVILTDYKAIHNLK